MYMIHICQLSTKLTLRSFSEPPIKATHTDKLYTHPPKKPQTVPSRTSTRFVKISSERKMALPTQMVLVYLGVILKIKTKKKANLISKNIHRVLRTICRYDSELRNQKLVKNFKLFPKFKKLLPQLPTLLLCQDPPSPQWCWQKATLAM